MDIMDITAGNASNSSNPSTLYEATPITSDTTQPSPSSSYHSSHSTDSNSLHLSSFEPLPDDVIVLEKLHTMMEHIECHHAGLSGGDKKKLLFQSVQKSDISVSNVVDLIAKIGKHGTKVNRRESDDKHSQTETDSDDIGKDDDEKTTGKDERKEERKEEIDDRKCCKVS